ncbi:MULTISPECIES: SDR family oxidoreductase [unclassified Rhizobium]|uniref:SDR family oxidoreductase n=1 Tax=unclassified Rhizobium TaxID=2613769 RepID=UPI000B0F4650|nr:MULTISPECIES: SDR family oxidoreductase [unclassified Rhizobium]MDM9622943.1 SDR family oxidoreductase [Rhizobium sp. S96]
MRTAIVTGASRGLGQAFAIGLAKDGFALGLCARDAAALEETANAARAAGAPRVVTVVADLSRASAAEKIVGETLAATGQIDALINNAGATKRGDFLALTDEDFLDGFALKFHATVRLCRAAWSSLSDRKGVIVNISGVGAHTPEPDFTIGGSVNSALINFTKAIAKRAQSSGMRVNTLCPGHILTDRLSRRIDVLAAERNISLDAAREELRIAQGIQRYGTPEEVANVVRFLCSPAATYVHGAVINVDGGATPGI